MVRYSPAVTTPPSPKLFQSSKGSAHSEEVASLRGKRLLIAEELAEGRSIDITALKRVQDVGMITARHVCQKDMTFRASHSLLTTTNYIPIVNETDHGAWRRLALLRFPYTFRKPGEKLQSKSDRRGDLQLKDRIKTDTDNQHDAIVTWVGWYADPAAELEKTPQIDRDTRAWRAEADRILGFWDERLIADREACILTAETLDEFNAWLESNGHKEWSRETFGPRFIQHNETSGHGVTEWRPRDPVVWPRFGFETPKRWRDGLASTRASVSEIALTRRNEILDRVDQPLRNFSPSRV